MDFSLSPIFVRSGGRLLCRHGLNKSTGPPPGGGSSFLSFGDDIDFEGILLAGEGVSQFQLGRGFPDSFLFYFHMIYIPPPFFESYYLFYYDYLLLFFYSYFLLDSFYFIFNFINNFFHFITFPPSSPRNPCTRVHQEPEGPAGRVRQAVRPQGPLMGSRWRPYRWIPPLTHNPLGRGGGRFFSPLHVQK